ncbi:MAG: SUMF1/EgtB/PvdO family nonheme iron enzyme [Pseudomonadota bacterium]
MRLPCPLRVALGPALLVAVAGCEGRAAPPVAPEVVTVAPAPAIPPPAPGPGRSPASEDMVPIPGGLVVLQSPPPGPLGVVHHAEGGAEEPESGPPQPWTSARQPSLGPLQVWVDPFLMDRTEVTREAYRAFLIATAYRPPFVDEVWAREGWNWDGVDYPPGTGDHPVVLVSWYDAQEFCAWRGARLPTEAEWQLAALGPASDGRVYPWGNTWDGSRLNHGRTGGEIFDDSDGYARTSPVGAYPAGRSVFGLEDTFGNAWEFTSDLRLDAWSLYQHREQGGVYHEVQAPGPGLYAAVRGGAFFFEMATFPAGERNQFVVEVRRKSAGFRCAR